MDGERNDGVVVGVFTHDEYQLVLEALGAYKGMCEKEKILSFHTTAKAVEKLKENMISVLKEGAPDATT